MGCFSWCLLDTRQELIMGQPFKVLIPEVFGGGEVITSYNDYGGFSHNGQLYDLYEILAAWNSLNIAIDEEGLIPISNFTNRNRGYGISMGCYDHEIAKLDFPLRLVSVLDDKTYEDYDGMFSIGAPSQGWDTETIYDSKLFHKTHYGGGET